LEVEVSREFAFGDVLRFTLECRVDGFESDPDSVTLEYVDDLSTRGHQFEPTGGSRNLSLGSKQGVDRWPPFSARVSDSA
jgi:hypothetical protein